MGIFMFNIHESIKTDFLENLKSQSLSLGKMFALILLVVSGLLIVLDAVLGWTSTLLFFRIVPIIAATSYLVYIPYFQEKYPKAFSFVYGFLLLACMLSASGICYKVFTHAGVQNIDKLGVALGTAITILVCYLFAGIAIVSFLWILGVPLLAGIALIYFNMNLTVIDWMALVVPLLVFATMGFLSGEQFFLKTKYFAVQRRNLHQAGLLTELKNTYKSLNDENIFLIEQLKSNATFDLLTSAFNRGAGLELLEKEFYFAQRNSEPMTLAYIKVDNIEWINREYGREFADKAILAVAQTLKETIRKSDLLIRVEDDQFIVVFKQCESRFAERIVERARNRTAGLSSQSSFEINFCAGFADSSNDEFSSVKQMVEVADEQMKNLIKTENVVPPPIEAQLEAQPETQLDNQAPSDQVAVPPLQLESSSSIENSQQTEVAAALASEPSVRAANG